jgi:hypothetical protein
METRGFLLHGFHFCNVYLDWGESALVDGELAVDAIVVAAVAEAVMGGARTGYVCAESDGWRGGGEGAHLDE